MTPALLLLYGFLAVAVITDLHMFKALHRPYQPLKGVGI